MMSENSKNYLELRHCNICDKYYIISGNIDVEGRIQLRHGHKIEEIEKYLSTIDNDKAERLAKECKEKYGDVTGIHLLPMVASDLIVREVSTSLAKWINNSFEYDIEFYNGTTNEY
jgi:hypothetical protein